MPSATFKITVDISQAAKLETFSTKLKPGAIKALQDSFRQALPTIISNERIKTGNMRRSTTLSASGQGAQIEAQAGYSGYQNFGTRYMSGTHFMEAGLSAIQQAIPTALNALVVAI